MTIISISNLNLLKVLDEDTNKIYYGCDQEWFLKKGSVYLGEVPQLPVILYLIL